MVKNIYLIRHAQSKQNAVNNTFSGSTNTPISLEGKIQAENAEKLTFPGGDNMLEKAGDFYQKMFEIASEQNYESIAIVSYSAAIRLF